MNVQPEGVWNKLAGIVGADYLRPAKPGDTIDDVLPPMIVEPANSAEVSEVLRAATAAGLRVASRGGGTKMAWGNRPRGLDLILSTRRLNRVVEHAWADLTATVEAGCLIADFQRVLAEHGQRLALDPLWPSHATIGGVLATNDTGPLRLAFGALRDLIIGITVVLPDGTVARSGGKVVKNVAGYDLPKLFTGSLGTLGVITEATFRLHPLPRSVRNFSLILPTAETLAETLRALQASPLDLTGLQLRALPAESLTIDLRLEGSLPAIEAGVAQLSSLAPATKLIDARPEIWQAREALWTGADPALIGKVSVVPARIAQFYTLVRQLADSLSLTSHLVMQGNGLGWLWLEAATEAALPAALTALRTDLAAADGSIVVLRCPAELKGRLDVWGEAGDALPLMRRVKERFDPAGTLNPGRFVGGI